MIELMRLDGTIVYVNPESIDAVEPIEGNGFPPAGGGGGSVTAVRSFVHAGGRGFAVRQAPSEVATKVRVYKDLAAGKVII